MDRLTANLLDALRTPGAELLLELLEGPAKEADLLRALDAASQPTANRRLREFEQLLLVTRDAGPKHAPGRTWALNHGDEVAALLAAATDLSGRLASADRERRRRTRRRVGRARKRPD